MKEKEINLMDIVVEILLKWRVFVVVMAVGAVLMGVFGYVRSIENVEAQKAAIVATEQELTEKKKELESSSEVREEEDVETITEAQRINVMTALGYEEYSASRRSYLESSVWINLDPLNIARTMLTFRITGTDRQTCYDIEKLYEDIFSSGASQWIADNSDTEMSSLMLTELISVSRSSKNWSDGADSFSVNIYHQTESESAELAQYVLAYMEQLEKELLEQVGEHDLELVSEKFSYILNTSLQDTQRNIQSSILSWDASAANLKSQFTEVERLYYNELVSDIDAQIPEFEKLSDPELEAEVKELEEKLETMTVSTPGIGMKYVVLGAILFAFLYAVVIFIQYIFNTKLRVSDNVSELYNITQLGMVPNVTSKKKILAIVDKWILLLRDRNKRKFTTEEATGLAAVAVKIAAKHEDADNILCIGCELKGNALQVSEVIQKELADAGVKMTILNNVLYNQEAMEQLQTANVAFLLEQAGSTLYEEVAKELELLRRQGIIVLGAVVVE